MVLENLKSGSETKREIRKLHEDLLQIRKELRSFRKNSNDSNARVVKLIKKVGPYVFDDLYEQLSADSKIKEVFVTELFEGIENVKVPLGVVNEASPHTNQTNLLYVVAIAAYRKCENIFEFGTWKGNTTYYLTFASEEAFVTTLDLPPEDLSAAEDIGSVFVGSDREHKINQILCDSHKFDIEPYRNKMDLIFVDGDHTYEGVKNDTEKAFQMLAPGGIIIWDDYEPKNPDIVRFFSEFTQEQPLFKIKKNCLLLYIDGVDVLGFETRRKKSVMGDSKD
jgi:predicted O-methyltransferase YrrM